MQFKPERSYIHHKNLKRKKIKIKGCSPTTWEVHEIHKKKQRSSKSKKEEVKLKPTMALIQLKSDLRTSQFK